MIHVEICSRCPHPAGDHAMVATGVTPVMGGVMVCPVLECTCYATWDVPPFSVLSNVRIPDEEELWEIRLTVWGQSLQ